MTPQIYWYQKGKYQQDYNYIFRFLVLENRECIEREALKAISNIYHEYFNNRFCNLLNEDNEITDFYLKEIAVVEKFLNKNLNKFKKWCSTIKYDNIDFHKNGDLILEDLINLVIEKIKINNRILVLNKPKNKNQRTLHRIIKANLLEILESNYWNEIPIQDDIEYLNKIIHSHLNLYFLKINDRELSNLANNVIHPMAELGLNIDFKLLNNRSKAICLKFISSINPNLKSYFFLGEESIGDKPRGDRVNKFGVDNMGDWKDYVTWGEELKMWGSGD